MSDYTVIEQHDWRGKPVGYEVRPADAASDTAADVLATFPTRPEADEYVAQQRQTGIEQIRALLTF